MSILSVVLEIDRCGRAINALNEIGRMHTPVEVCRWCAETRCRDSCRYTSRYVMHVWTVCPVCCLDGDGSLSDGCLFGHDHEDSGPVCRTAEIIAGAGL